MKVFSLFICSVLLLLFSTAARPETYDALKDYSCMEGGSGIWNYEGYRAEDGSYLAMLFGHPSLREVSRYGVDAYYLPDSGQDFYPFMSGGLGQLICSPATHGKRYDAVLSWTAPNRCTANVSGFARLLGDMRGNAQGRKVTARLLINGDEVWRSPIAGGESREFKFTAPVAAGDRLRLHIQNAGDESGDITAVNLHIETEK